MKKLAELPLIGLPIAAVLTTWAVVTSAPPVTGAPTGGRAALVVAYNSPEKWANWGEVLKTFSAKTGLQAPSDPKNSGQTLAALKAEAAAPQADTAYFGIVFGIQAAEAGLLEPYKPAGFAEIPAGLKDPEGRWMTIHQGAVAFLVNTKVLGNTPMPQCWADLTKNEYKGKVGFLDPTQAAIGYSVATAANLALGGTLENWDPGIQYLAQLKANDLQLPAQTATALVQQGEIPILIDADFNGYQLKNNENAPVEVVIPCEGSLAIPYVIGLVKGAPNPQGGKQLIDFTLSNEGQALFAKSYLRPVRQVSVDPGIAAKMLPDSAYAKVTVPDFAQMRAVQEQFNERWKAEVMR
ncbi:extracellular solute-binding protein [Synechococcus sp. H55.7]|uniref:extracellular solute-binding protein n=1 Tax=unclassified Synechococcus TaxID=2626047 RepID=UPI0039C1D2CA